MIHLPAKVSAAFRTEFFREITRRTAKIITIHIFAAVLLFGANFMIIRFFGEPVYGSFVIVNLWLSFFSVLVLWGMDDFFVANLPAFLKNPERPAISRKILVWAIRICLLVFLMIAIIFILLSQTSLVTGELFDQRHLLLGLTAALTLLLLLSGFLRGLNRIIAGQVADKIIRPVFFIAGLSVCILSGAAWGVETVLLVQLGSILLAIAVLLFFLKPVLAAGNTPQAFPRTLRGNMTFLLISLLYLFSTRLDLFFLAGNIPVNEVGYYNIAARLAEFAAYPLIALNLVVPNHLSGIYHHQPAEMPGYIRRFTWISAGIMAAGFVFILLFGKWILALFGSNFTTVYIPLLILAGGHFFAAWAAPVNAYFMISGRQKHSLYALGAGVAAIFCLCLILVPQTGAVGAAIAIAGGHLVFLIMVLLTYSLVRHRAAGGRQ